MRPAQIGRRLADRRHRPDLFPEAQQLQRTLEWVALIHNDALAAGGADLLHGARQRLVTTIVEISDLARIHHQSAASRADQPIQPLSETTREPAVALAAQHDARVTVDLTQQ